jgi:hypothetical protein
MDRTFMLSFLFIMIASLVMDRKRLRHERTSVKVTYGLIALVTMGLFICKYLHWRIPIPTRFFIHTVSPWVSSLIGL